MARIRWFRKSLCTPPRAETSEDQRARPEYPETLSVEVTSACNLKCKMCALTIRGTRSSRSAGNLNEVVWRQILQASERVGHINLNGWGENFLNPRFLDYLRELDARGVRTNFSTNGYFLTADTVAELAAVRHLTHVNVSIDSPDPKIYETIRGRPLAPAMQGLRNLVNGLPRPERITVSSIVMKDNVESLADFPELLGKVGVRGYVLQGLVDTNQAPCGVGHDRAAEIVAQIGADCARLGISVLVHPYLHHLLADREPAIWHALPEFARRDLRSALVPVSKQCASPWDHVFVNKDGLVMPCCNCPAWESDVAGEEGVMGDLKTQTFAEIWHGETFSRFRTGMLQGDLPAVCRTCNLVSTGPHFFKTYAARLVRGGCRVQQRGQRVNLLVENRGCVPWTSETGLRVGTVRPRDRISILHHPSWVNENRAAEWTGAAVYPGKRARLSFFVAPAPPSAPPEHLKLVVDDVCWLPGTELILESDSRTNRWRLRQVD